MKTQNLNNKLAFGKATVTELNDVELEGIDGGTSLPCIAISIASIKLSYDISKDLFE
jgi:hypothetical protein